jgi:hypothetical protein
LLMSHHTNASKFDARLFFNKKIQFKNWVATWIFSHESSSNVTLKWDHYSHRI